MKRSAVTSFLSILTAASISAVASTFSPANAYTVTFIKNDDNAGNPVSSHLVKVGLNSRDDQGRQLNPISWLVPAGTKSDYNPEKPSSSLIGTPIALSALLNIKVLEFNAQKLSLDLQLTNTTDINNVFYNNEPFKANILSFGFGVSPNATSIVMRESGSLFNTAEIQNTGNGNQNFPGGFKHVDVCIYAAKNCSGGDVNQGLQAGKSDRFTLDIFGNFSDTNTPDPLDASVTLSDFPLKFQTSVGSYEPAGVPEPITVVGSGLALGFGALFKKEATKKRKKVNMKG